MMCCETSSLIPYHTDGLTLLIKESCTQSPDDYSRNLNNEAGPSRHIPLPDSSALHLRKLISTPKGQIECFSKRLDHFASIDG